jgi:hypothetical protein
MARTTFLSNAKNDKEKAIELRRTDYSPKYIQSPYRHHSLWQESPHQKGRGYDTHNDITQKKVDRSREERASLESRDSGDDEDVCGAGLR